MAPSNLLILLGIHNGSLLSQWDNYQLKKSSHYPKASMTDFLFGNKLVE
jgi:hypothetical protein